MRQRFFVDDDLVEKVWVLAQPKPFENLSFNDALRRVLKQPTRLDELSADDLLAELASDKPKRRTRAQSPDARLWLAQVPELATNPKLHNWISICRHLGIDANGDSARRSLSSWVADNRPEWPTVPTV